MYTNLEETYYRSRWLIKLLGERCDIERNTEEIERITGPRGPTDMQRNEMKVDEKNKNHSPRKELGQLKERETLEPGDDTRG